MVYIQRTLLGMTQTQLGKDAGLGHQSISKIENGEIQLSAVNLYNLARALSVPVGYFFETYKNEG